MKIIKQLEMRDCAAACLSMIATHYGLKYPIQKYRVLSKTDRNGTNLYGIVDAAEQLGFSSQALKGSFKELISSLDKDIELPIIAHVMTEQAALHYIVVYKIKNNIIYVADPEKGKAKYSVDEFSSLWTGYIVTFRPNARFKKGNHAKGRFIKFFSAVKGKGKELTVIIIASVLISLIGILGAYIFEIVVDSRSYSDVSLTHAQNTEAQAEHAGQASIIDKAISFISDNSKNLNLFFVLVIGLYILQALIQWIRGYMIARLAKHMDESIMLPYYSHVIDMPVAQINTRQTGEYLSRFSDAYTIRNAISGATLTLILDSLMTVVGAVMLYLQNSVLFFVALIMVVIYAVVVTFYRKPLKRINERVMENNAVVQSYFKETVDGVTTIKANTSEELFKEKNKEKFSKFVDSLFKNNLLNVSQDTISDLVELVGTVLIIWLGTALALKGVITMGSLTTFYALLAYFTQPIKNLIELQPMLQTAFVAAERLDDVLSIELEKNQNNACSESKRLFDKHITISDLDFRYGNRDLVLKNINMRIRKGEKVAIVGESGSGKTTLAKLLLRFYEPEAGKIRFDGIDIGEISPDELRRKIAYIDQATFIFSDTIKNNIKLSNPDATRSDIELACKLSNADVFIGQLPLGLDTFLDENGNNLSGGQKQRISIARALLRKPEVIIFDEATSNLDAITESKIKETIFNLGSDLTSIIIAHRLSTIKNCDKIFVVEDGRIIESGTFTALISNQSSSFYRMIEKYRV